MKPEVRFKNFGKDWRSVPLEICLEICTELNAKNTFDVNDVLSVSDEVGVINQIKHLGRSYAGKSVSRYKVLRKGQIVYTKSPLRDKPFGVIKVNNGSVGIVSVLYAVYKTKDGINPDFIQFYFSPSFRINSYFRPLINKGAKNTMNISDEMALTGNVTIPCRMEEQEKISSYFDLFETLIQANIKKIASLKQIKAASLQSMFPQEGETTPRIRFKGFEGEWKRVLLEECLKINTEKNIDKVFGINDVLSVSDEVGVVNQIKLLGRSYAGKSVSGYNILKTNQIVYTKSPLKSKPYGIIKVNRGEDGIVSVLYAVYDTKVGVSSDYIHYYFAPCFRINNYLLPLVNKGAKNTMNISDEMALQGYLMIPSFEEQIKIASYFNNLDRQITLQTRRLEKLKQIKAACLDKMFV